MKRIGLFAGVVVAVLLSMAVRSQDADAVIEPLLKEPVAEPAAPAPVAVEAPAIAEVVPALEPAAAPAAVEAPVAEAPIAEAPLPPPALEDVAEVAPQAAPVDEGAHAEPVTVVAVSDAEGLEDDLAAGIVERSDGMISVNLEEIPMSEVVKLFSQISGANIIAATSNLTGTVSASLKNVKWQPAFESILSRHDLLLTERPLGSGIYVIESGRAGEEPRVTETIHLRYAKVDRMATLINTMLGKDGKATAFADGNAILVQAPASRIAEVRRIVESLDKARGQVYIEARFVEMTAAASKKLGLRWNSLENVRFGVQDIGGGFINSQGHLRQYLSGVEIVEDITQPLVQTVTDRSYDDEGNLINDASKTEVTYPYKTKDPVYRVGPISAAAGMNEDELSWKRMRGIKGQISASDFSLAMSAFESEDGVSMISNPKIIVANEETAVVDMTTKEPYVKVTANRTSGSEAFDITTELGIIPGKNEPFVGEAFFSYGVSLKVQPRVSSSGVITVMIEPSISSKEGTYVVEGADNTPSTKYPIISMKKINTTFSMIDGSTAVIGGLTRSGEDNIDSGIPLLRDIPWIGPRLFGWKSRYKEQNEIVIFVTVGIVDPEKEMPENVGMPKNAVLSRDFQEPGDLPRGEVMRLKK